MFNDKTNKIYFKLDFIFIFFLTGVPLTEGWKRSIQEIDHSWIAKALFKWSTRGKPELDPTKVTQMWYHPPQPALVTNNLPAVHRYFSRRLLLWMPRKLWQVKLTCPQEDCETKPELTSAGLYPLVRQVFDLDSFYYLATEYLECSGCKRKVISWSQGILNQLDAGHRRQFPVILTHKFAVDRRIVRLLRQRGIGNSSSQLRRKLVEQHNEVWLERVTQYLTDCESFVRASNKGLVSRPSFDRPPPCPQLPNPRVLLSVYCSDVLARLEEVKAAITSTFGRVLKIDSTKKVIKVFNFFFFK